MFSILLQSPHYFLLCGLLLGFLLSVEHPIRGFAKKLSSKVLQSSVVLFAAGLNFNQVLNTGLFGVFLTFCSIAATFALGLLLARIFKIERPVSFLISAGTAICGGSAIAALTPVLKPSKADIAVSIGIVFLLNALAVFIFPPIGKWLEFSDSQFGFWAALAIHDTSSVIAASQIFSESALAIAAQLKLTRALWIVPMVLVFSRFSKDKANSKPSVPWFILVFLLVSIVFTFVETFHPFSSTFKDIGKLGFSFALFLVGVQIDEKQIRRIPFQVFAFGICLWVLVVVGSLAFVRFL